MHYQKVVSIANHKGGVAKSQTVIELSYYLASQGNKVLVIDTDPQANASDILLRGAEPEGRRIAEILIANKGIESSDIQTRRFDNNASVDFICSGIDAVRLEARITATIKEFVFADALATVKDKYDFVVIDTPPSSELLSLSALIASDCVLVPVTPDKPSIDGVHSIIRMTDTICTTPRLNPNLWVKGILVTRYRATLSTMRGVHKLKEEFGNLVISQHIRECTRVQQAVEDCKPVQEYDPSCNAAKDYYTAFKTMYKQWN